MKRTILGPGNATFAPGDKITNIFNPFALVVRVIPQLVTLLFPTESQVPS
jgi:hypothetical protein